MPSTIPYDPSLVLGNIVEQPVLDNVVRIAELQAPADAAQSEMNSLITLKRSIDMTVQEMIDMGINAEELALESKAVGEEISKAAVAYGKAKVNTEKAIRPLKAKISEVHSQIESPIDYNRSKLKPMPISSDSMEMNVQYFSFDENTQDSASHASSVSSFIGDSLSYFGQSFSSQASRSTQNQVNSQTSKHSISGTLVVCITCTHKNAQIFAPFILDVDKAVRVWNRLYPGDMLKTNSPASIALAEAAAETPGDKSFTLLSGATYGSSFIGMVHILNTSKTTSSQDVETIANSLVTTFKVGGWFAENTGGFGVNSSFANSAKNLLSTQNIQSHCSLVTMGVIPSIKSNTVKIAVQEFANFSPDEEMKHLVSLQNATASENDTMYSAAGAAKTGRQSIEMKGAKIEAVLSAVGKIDDGENKIIDINSMMAAMEDYITKCIGGGDNFGVPINYYLKPITKSMIARSWLAKYYPNSFNKAGSADDSKTEGGTSGGGNP